MSRSNHDSTVEHIAFLFPCIAAIAATAAITTKDYLSCHRDPANHNVKFRDFVICDVTLPKFKLRKLVAMWLQKAQQKKKRENANTRSMKRMKTEPNVCGHHILSCTHMQTVGQTYNSYRTFRSFEFVISNLLSFIFVRVWLDFIRTFILCTLADSPFPFYSVSSIFYSIILYFKLWEETASHKF